MSRGPTARPRIASIDHADPAKARTYADPMLMARADWRDDYRYAADGTPLGWTRTRGDLTEGFTPDGARILARAADGTPLAVETVGLPLRRDEGAGSPSRRSSTHSALYSLSNPEPTTHETATESHDGQYSLFP